MHFAAGCRLADRSRIPASYYENNVGGTLCGARGDGRRRRATVGVLLDLRHLRQADETPIHERRIRSARSTPTARRSWPSNTRCRISSARTACARSRCATSTPPAPIPRASSARTTRPKCTSSRGRSTRRLGATRSRSSATITDAGRDMPSRLRPRHGPRGAHVLALDALLDRRPRRPTTWGTGSRPRCATCSRRSSG